MFVVVLVLVVLKVIDVDVVFEKIYVLKGNFDFNYKILIVDFMKLIGMDLSFDNCKMFVIEFGYDGEKDGLVEMNIWLYKVVMECICIGK